MLLNGKNERYPQGTIIVPLKDLSRTRVDVGDHIEDIMRTAVLEGASFVSTSLPGKTNVLIGEKRYSVTFDIKGFVTSYTEEKDQTPHLSPGRLALAEAINIGNETIIRRELADRRKNGAYNSIQVNFLTEIPLAHLHPNPAKAEKIVKILVDEGINLNAVNELGETALHIACAINDQEWIKALIMHGASTDSIDYTGKTPKDYLKENKEKTTEDKNGILTLLEASLTKLEDPTYTLMNSTEVANTESILNQAAIIFKNEPQTEVDLSSILQEYLSFSHEVSNGKIEEEMNYHAEKIALFDKIVEDQKRASISADQIMEAILSFDPDIKKVDYATKLPQDPIEKNLYFIWALLRNDYEVLSLYKLNEATVY